MSCFEPVVHAQLDRRGQVSRRRFLQFGIAGLAGSQFLSQISLHAAQLKKEGKSWHVFNIPVALRSCMEMVKPGGRFILVTPANNFCGHGFYQFSPELFFRTLAPEHGFEVERMVACEAFPLGRWYRIEDPARVGRRVELVTAHRVLLFVQARRTTADTVLSTWPQQSDYQALWSDRKRQAGRRARRARPRRRDTKDELQRILYRLCPPVAYRVRAWLDRYKTRRCGLESRRSGYERVRS